MSKNSTSMSEALGRLGIEAGIVEPDVTVQVSPSGGNVSYRDACGDLVECTTADFLECVAEAFRQAALGADEQADYGFATRGGGP